LICYTRAELDRRLAQNDRFVKHIWETSLVL
jgi:hypothetical protein